MIIFINFILKLVVLISFTLLIGCASSKPNSDFSTIEDSRIENGSVFSKAQALILAHDFENALPFIKRSLEANTDNYFESLLLAARAYDQLAQPEKAILALQEYLKQKPAQKELTARTLLLKNQAKVKTDLNKNRNYQIIQKLTVATFPQKALEDWSWALDFKCDRYCAEEIYFFQEIQLNLLYIVEQDNDASKIAAELIRSRYTFFQKATSTSNLKSKLYSSLRKLKALTLVPIQKNRSSSSAELIESLTPLEKELESGLTK